MSSIANLSGHLERMVGRDRVQTSEAVRKEFQIARRAPTAVLKPGSPEEVAEIISFAGAEKLAVVACGSRSKLDLGTPPQRYDLALDMTDLRQIAHYDPGDLTVSVDAGLPLRDLAKALAEKHQFLPLAVPCSATSTIGGAIASGIDSIFRQQYGTARDFLVGAEFVDGTGRRCKSGGRVVKNVTGYDLHKLLIGSLGTLGIITRLNFRTFPLPELRRAHIAAFPEMEAALNFHEFLSKSGLPFSNLELFDPQFSTLFAGYLNRADGNIPESLGDGGWHVFASFEGSAAVIERIQRELRERYAQAQAKLSCSLDAPNSRLLSEALSEAFEWLRSVTQDATLFRIVLPQWAPADIAEIQNLAESLSQREAFALRACSVGYFLLHGGADDAQQNTALERCASDVCSLVEAKGGSATLLHAPAWLKDRTKVWGSERPDFSLMQRVKQAFDPHNIFAPGRFVGGI